VVRWYKQQESFELQRDLVRGTMVLQVQATSINRSTMWIDYNSNLGWYKYKQQESFVEKRDLVHGTMVLQQVQATRINWSTMWIDYSSNLEIVKLQATRIIRRTTWFGSLYDGTTCTSNKNQLKYNVYRLQ
jgi:hypothetical protein